MSILQLLATKFKNLQMKEDDISLNSMFDSVTFPRTALPLEKRYHKIKIIRKIP